MKFAGSCFEYKTEAKCRYSIVLSVGAIVVAVVVVYTC